VAIEYVAIILTDLQYHYILLADIVHIVLQLHNPENGLFQINKVMPKTKYQAGVQVHCEMPPSWKMNLSLRKDSVNHALYTSGL